MDKIITDHQMMAALGKHFHEWEKEFRGEELRWFCKACNTWGGYAEQHDPKPALNPDLHTSGGMVMLMYALRDNKVFHDRSLSFEVQGYDRKKNGCFLFYAKVFLHEKGEHFSKAFRCEDNDPAVALRGAVEEMLIKWEV